MLVCTDACPVVLQGYGPDAVASAANTLDPSSKKVALEAVQKAGHSFPATSMNGTASTARPAPGQWGAFYVLSAKPVLAVIHVLHRHD